uniref:protein-serine/threonine phosphatase n=1 Tax=Ananas comosus var. bracteatus TaxID=296719 RepID=A0A6V7NTK4_ANACO|nr:unnamed protein product [Ananas comosus var. bracteatus]
MNHQYEGCTATILLIWFAQSKECFVQCANVGDSSCFVNVNGQQIMMTEDHRVTSMPERARLAKLGRPLKDGEARLSVFHYGNDSLLTLLIQFMQNLVDHIIFLFFFTFPPIASGLNISRMLGDKFLKEQDSRFSSEPYISQVVHITKACTAFALIASDGLWDVISVKKAVQLFLENRERFDIHDNDYAEKIANCILEEARMLRTKDNTSVIFLDFDTLRSDSGLIKS